MTDVIERKLIELTKLQLRCNELMLRSLRRMPVRDVTDGTLDEEIRRLCADIRRMK